MNVKTKLYITNKIFWILIQGILFLLKSQYCIAQQNLGSNNKIQRLRDTSFISQNNNINTVSVETPRIITKNVHITSYEHHTVVLPCEITNLPRDMHVIWQYGKEGMSQVVLTIGQTLIENNYRVRVISNSSNEENHLPFDSLLMQSAFSSNIVKKSTENVINNNLEIRKLQLADSGWYECQLPTKPTQKNYVYLEVLSLPKIEPTVKHARIGDTIELLCQVKNLPNKFEVHWLFNEHKIDAYTINKITSGNGSNHIRSYMNDTHSIHYNTRDGTELKLKSKKHFTKFNKVNRRSLLNHKAKYTIVNDKIQNLTISRLKIKDLDDYHKGIYKCRYDKAEAKYNLDIKSGPRTRTESYDQLFSYGNKLTYFKTVNIWLNLFAFLFLF